MNTIVEQVTVFIEQCFITHHIRAMLGINLLKRFGLGDLIHKSEPCFKAVFRFGDGLGLILE